MITKRINVVDIEVLLNLDGEIFPMDNGYWVKFEAKEVTKTKEIPHGIKYSLTLHNKKNERVIGYDNAHALKSTKKYGAKKETWDHIHKTMDVVAYEFDTPAKLIEDFWVIVEYYIENNG
jgi:hypothetical protein